MCRHKGARGADHKVSAVVIKEHLKVREALPCPVAVDKLVSCLVRHRLVYVKRHSREKLTVVGNVITAQSVVPLLDGRCYEGVDKLRGGGIACKLFLGIRLGKDLGGELIVGRASKEYHGGICTLNHEIFTVFADTSTVYRDVEAVFKQDAVVIETAARGYGIIGKRDLAVLTHTVTLVKIVVTDKRDNIPYAEGNGTAHTRADAHSKDTIRVRSEALAHVRDAAIVIADGMYSLVE